jgi:hypothetical protein
MLYFDVYADLVYACEIICLGAGRDGGWTGGVKCERRGSR